MKHFVNPELLAPNVLTMPVDAGIVGEFAAIAADHEDGERFDVASPPWNSDIVWVSARDKATFEIFQSAFDRLSVAERVAPYLDLDRAVRLYCGFLVIRSQCAGTNFHVDWKQANNEAFTLITPIGTDAGDFGLLYRRMDGETGEYRYRHGEAIVFGDHFSHSTKPGRSDAPVALLSFTFGTDRMEHWPRISLTAGYQSALWRLPDGRFQRRQA